MKINEEIKGNVLYQHCKSEVPKEYKIKIAKLLNQILKEYDIKGRDEETLNAFKNIFKSNLNWIIDDLIVKVKEEKNK